MQDAATRTDRLADPDDGPATAPLAAARAGAWLARAVESLGEGWALADAGGRLEDIAGAFFAMLDSPAPHRRPGARLRDVVWALRSDEVLSWPPDQGNTGWRWTARRQDGQAVALEARPLGGETWVLRARLGTDARMERAPTAGLYHAATRLPQQPLLIDRLQQAVERSRRTVTHRFALILIDLTATGEAAAFDDGQLRTIGHELVEAVRPADTVAHLDPHTLAVIVEPLRGDDAAVRVAVESVTENLRRALEDSDTGAAAVARFAIAIGDGASHPSDLVALGRQQLAEPTGAHAASPSIQRTAASIVGDGPYGASFAFAVEHDLRNRQACGLAVQCAELPKPQALLEALATHPTAGRWPGGWVPDLIVSLDQLPRLDALLTLKQTQTSWQPSGRLIVELDEGAVARDPEAAIQLVDAAVHREIRVGVHRFGLGDSSDALISHMPLTRLTLHARLVAEARQRVQARVRLAATIAWAHERRLRVVAARSDGADPDPQLTSMLANLGCDLHRGAAG
ncbi:MAG: EAL domain-containing protein [Alphaproteobacteria bacterium]